MVKQNNTCIIAYGSCYGSAERYAKLLSELTGIPAQSYRSISDTTAFDRIVYIGSLYAGGVTGLESVSEKLSKDTNLILVTVGLADPNNPETVRHIRNSLHRQMPQELLDHCALFHLRGAIDYRRLSLKHRGMMAVAYRRAKRIPPEKQNPETAAIVDTYGKTVDYTDFSALMPIVRIMELWEKEQENDHE